VEVTRETSPTHYVFHGRTIVGTEAIPICPKFPTNRNVLLRAKPTNTAVIYIGLVNVAADDSESVGFPMEPGFNLTVPIDDPSQVYAISSDVDQILYWIGV
jgi:hypothetical protein